MHGRVPVKATKEHRRQFACGAHIGIAGEHMGNLVGILEMHAGERETGKSAGGRSIHRRAGVRRDRRTGNGRQQQQYLK